METILAIFYLKNGQTITIHVDSLDWSVNSSGEIISINAKYSAQSRQKLSYINLSEVVAIVTEKALDRKSVV